MEALFVEVLKLCREAGLLRLGVIALDGTKIKANAALDANRTARSLAEEVAAVFAEAEAVDAAEDVLSGERRGDVLRIQPIAGRHRSGGSSWQSLARGSGSIETDYLNGEIVLLGRLHGIPTPVNALLQRLANEAARERRKPGGSSEDALLRLLG